MQNQLITRLNEMVGRSASSSARHLGNHPAAAWSGEVTLKRARLGLINLDAAVT